MRVPDSLFFDRSQLQLAQKRADLAEAQSQATTGKRVQKPSDDPLASALARRAGFRENRAEGYERTVNVAQSALQVAEDALHNVSESLQRARELALQAASDTQSAEGRAAAAHEVQQIREQIRDLANTEVGGRYAFGGFRTDTAPFDESGGYQGSAQGPQVDVAPGVRLPLGVTGDRVFGSGTSSDVFAVLDSLEQALSSNDVDAVRSSLDGLEQGVDNVTAARGELGGYIASAETSRAAAQRVRDSAEVEQSNLTDADAFTAFSDLARAQQALEAAVTIASQLPQPGLVSRS